MTVFKAKKAENVQVALIASSGSANRKLDVNSENFPGIALHPQRGAMVWIESYANHNRIMSANMDGTNVRVLVENKLEYPTGISIDLITSNVYFGDVEREMIERVNMDTRERTVVLTKGVHHPFDLKYFNGFLYWSDWASSSLKVAEMSTHHSSAHLIHSFTALPFGLAINHSMYQPTPSSFPCQSNDCRWMCVSIPNAEGDLQAKCLCPDGYLTLPDGDCGPIRDSVVQDDQTIQGVGGFWINSELLQDISHVGVAWMKERCEAGSGCLNGGECQDVKNEHGRVTKIVCNCVSPYEGDRCERTIPSVSTPTSSRHPLDRYGSRYYLRLFLSCSSLLRSCYPIVISNKSGTRGRAVVNLPRKGSGVLRKEFSNPLFNDDRSSTGSSAEEQPANE
ncbi:Low-density lipoprotein receptor repeat class B, partial [Ostertagia ostertagi]